MRSTSWTVSIPILSSLPLLPTSTIMAGDSAKQVCMCMCVCVCVCVCVCEWGVGLPDKSSYFRTAGL